MWFDFIVFALTALYFVVWMNTRKSREVEHENRGQIPKIGTWGLTKVALLMYTRYRNLGNYIVSYKFSQQYGPLVNLNFPGRETINCTDLPTSKKVMTSPEWQDRFGENHYSVVGSFGKPIGLIASTGEYWTRARKLSVHLFHQLGFYRLNNVEAASIVEAAEIEGELRRLVEQEPGGEVLFCPHETFQVNTLNVVWQMLMGTRFPRGDPTAAEITRTLNAAAAEMNVGFSIMEYVPFLRHFPRLTFLGSFLAFCDHQYGLFREIITEKRRRKLEGDERDQKDFVDYFLQEIDKAEDDEYLNDETLMVVLRDIMIGSLDTVNSAIEHAVLFMALNPEVQTRVQTEIDELIGKARAPVYMDEYRMPFTRAVILEILRISSPVPVTARTSTERTRLDKNKINKGTMFGINIWAIHHSESIWPDPYVFRPGRFLNDDNQVINTDKIIPFGFGKRMCVGKHAGNVTLFIFFVSLLQHFSFGIPKDRPPPTFQYSRSLSRSPKPYSVTVRQRI